MESKSLNEHLIRKARIKQNKKVMFLKYSNSKNRAMVSH